MEMKGNSRYCSDQVICWRSLVCVHPCCCYCYIQIEAYQSVVNADTQLGGGGFGGFLGGRMGGGGRRRPAPTPDQVSALFRSRFEELDAELLAANTPPGGSGLTGEDVQHALRYYGADKDVQAVERKVLATDPLAVALNPVVSRLTRA